MPQDETEYGEFIYQYFAVPEETRLRLEAEGLAYNLGKQYTIPVSYTHLDVYKRQILTCC